MEFGISTHFLNDFPSKKKIKNEFAFVNIFCFTCNALGYLDRIAGVDGGIVTSSYR